MNTKKKKIVVTGTTGMLGSMVFSYLSKNPDLEVVSYNRNDAYSKISTPQYDYCINCVGVIKPFIKDETGEQVKLAIEGNIWYPYHLATLKNIKRFLSIATDCVFSGEAGGYTETDLHDCTDVYGKTKSLGEVKQDNWHNLRCSIIGPETRETKYSLLEWFLAQKGEVNGFCNHRWNGLTVLAYAQICERIILNDIELPNIQHIVPEDICTKHDLLYLLKRRYDKDIRINKKSGGSIVDRTLHTNNRDLNNQLWGGENKVKTIDEMIKELSEYKL